MSFQAVTWAIQQKTGGTSGKAALLSIANYAGENWCSWPSQTTVADESEQSVDSVQRRFRELAKQGLLRRIPMRFAGRKTVDFLILAPSAFYGATLEQIEAILPRGCEIDRRAVAADCGSDTDATDGAEAAAEPPQDAGSIPQTLPQSAAAVTAMVRQQEPSTEPLNQDERDARAHEGEDHVPDLPLLDKLKGMAPTVAHDSQAEIERAWVALDRIERREAVDGYPSWLSEKGRRTAIAGLPVYLREKRWKLLKRPMPAQGGDQQSAPAFSRLWYACFVDYTDHFREALSIRNSPEHGLLARHISAAKKFSGPWKMSSPMRERVEAAAASFVQVGKGSPAAEAWLRHYRDRGIDLPIPDKAEFIFMPSLWPPETPKASATADDMQAAY